MCGGSSHQSGGGISSQYSLFNLIILTRNLESALSYEPASWEMSLAYFLTHTSRTLKDIISHDKIYIKLAILSVQPVVLNVFTGRKPSQLSIG